MLGEVDKSQRGAKRRAHTATHLLHAELTKIFSLTKQEGSFVDEDFLRFDFASQTLLTHDNLEQITENINNSIKSSHQVLVQEMDLDSAKALGAKAFFGDKYGDQVRVVQIGDNSEQLSIELCGGTHVSNTSEIGAFTIISQEAVSAGVKRITAATGTKVSEELQKLIKERQNRANKFDCQPKQLDEKIPSVIKQIGELQDKIKSLETKSIQLFLQSTLPLSLKGFSRVIDLTTFSASSGIILKDIVAKAKEVFPDQTIALFDSTGAFALLGTNTFSVKKFAQESGIKGGGNDLLVQGKDINIVKLFS